MYEIFKNEDVLLKFDDFQDCSLADGTLKKLKCS